MTRNISLLLRSEILGSGPLNLTLDLALNLTLDLALDLALTGLKTALKNLKVLDIPVLRVLY